MAIPTIPRKAQQINIQIDKGSTFRSQIIWSVGDPALPKNLTGYTGRMQIRSDIDSTEILHELTTENGGIILDEPNGKITLFISDSDSTAFVWNDGVYGLEMIDTADTEDVRRLIYGDIECFDEVTR